MGAKLYELTDHLGNVRAVIGDVKLADGGSFKVDLKSYTNYYPYGMEQPQRAWRQGEDYRYGYNGVEEDDELKGEGNSLSTYYRLYDPRLALWLGIDPVVHESESPYAFSSGNPILYADPSGADKEIEEINSPIQNPNKNSDLADRPDKTVINYNGQLAAKFNGTWSHYIAEKPGQTVKQETNWWSGAMQSAQDLFGRTWENVKEIGKKVEESTRYSRTFAVGALSTWTEANTGLPVGTNRDDEGYRDGGVFGYKVADAQSKVEFVASAWATAAGINTMTASGGLAAGSAPFIPVFGTGLVGEGAAAAGVTAGAITTGVGLGLGWHSQGVGQRAKDGLRRLSEPMQMKGSGGGGGGNTGGSGNEFKKPKSNLSGKEGAKDVPSWVRGNKPRVGENGDKFAKRLLDDKYGKGNYKTGSQSEYSQIKKWGDRAFE